MDGRMEQKTNNLTQQQHDDDDENSCLKCKHCCTYEVFPIGCPEDDILELAYYKGINTFWDSRTKEWYISMYRPCNHLKMSGCNIYTKYRPALCRTWMCDHPKWMRQRYNILVVAGKCILKQKFRGKLNNE